MIQGYLAREAQRIHDTFMRDVASREEWEKLRPRYEREYLHMLGLWPMPEKSPLKATVTGTLAGDGYAVDMLHYQSVPGLYVTGNLYRPARIEPGQRLPAVLYVCGHSFCGRDGNKIAYQSHGLWFARHGYVCLVLDTLQLGEIAAIHHGTYREGRWWWHSRGYTSAGVECLNGIRGIDYLVGRTDVDPERIAVTGISGGGAATFWIAAADERVKVAVPVSGMADLPSYVSNRVINGHCDCMFLYNTFQWPWTRIASLIAPRPMLFTNSDADAIFPMDANQRVINRLERVYSLFGAGDLVDSFVSIGGHAYRQDIRQAAYRFINTHLKDDPRAITDSEVDIPTGPRNKREYSIDPKKLRVFPTDTDIPTDELNTTIDRHFVPMAQVEPPDKGTFESWKAPLLAELRRVTFRYFPERIPPAQWDGEWLISEPGICVGLKRVAGPATGEKAARVLLIVRNLDPDSPATAWRHGMLDSDYFGYMCTPRGVDETRWTRKNPPNYVERSHVLLGRTVDTGRVWDIIAAARHLHAGHAGIPLYVVGEDPAAAVLAAYAALLEPEIAGVIAVNPPASHMDANAPQFLNVLRVCDIPDVLGMLAPRPLTIHGQAGDWEKVARIYSAADARDKLRIEAIGKAPVRIIFDTDMDTDCDDAGAMAVLHTLADQGEAEILATLVSSHYRYSVPCVAAINAYYSRPDLPVGCPKGAGADTNRGSAYARQIAEAFPSVYRSNEDAPNAATIYRRLLSAEEDNSVVIATVGYVTNLRDLLATGPDSYSPLSGPELVRRKVKRWVCMGGRYPSHLDPAVYGNFKPDPVSAVEAASKWPGEIVFTGLGDNILTGSTLRQTPEKNPVRRAYELYLRDKPARPSWDPIAVLYAIRPDEPFWRVEESGYNHIFPNGTNEWRQTPDDPRHKLLQLQPGAEGRLQSIMEELMSRSPAK
jgi:dienelactone hydrolase